MSFFIIAIFLFVAHASANNACQGCASQFNGGGASQRPHLMTTQFGQTWVNVATNSMNHTYICTSATSSCTGCQPAPLRSAASWFAANRSGFFFLTPLIALPASPTERHAPTTFSAAETKFAFRQLSPALALQNGALFDSSLRSPVAHVFLQRFLPSQKLQVWGAQ